MKNLSWYLILLALALFAIPANGQDSVSRLGTGLPADSDAVNPYDIGEQLNTYVVDMTPFTTSWGTRFGMAPLAKTGKVASGFFNNLMSGQFLSQDFLKNQRYAFSTYSYWNEPGYGVHNTNNWSPTELEIGNKMGNQFAATFAEFGLPDASGIDGNYVVTAMVNYSNTRPDRLYVARIGMAANGMNLYYNQTALGIGAVDANGNTYVRADGYNVGGPDPIDGNNIFRIRALGRDYAALNFIGLLGASDTTASDWILANAGINYSCPNCIPESMGSHPVYFGPNFNAQLAYEATPNTVAWTSAHLGSSSDQRGCPTFSKNTIFPNTVGTGVLTGKDGNGESRRVLLWGMNGNGSVNGTAYVEPPLTIVDNGDGYDFPTGGIGPIDEKVIGWFITYGSQLVYRGGCGPNSVGIDQEGRAIVAFHVARGKTPTNNTLFNAIAVARFDPSNPPPAGPVEWTLAGYVDDSTSASTNGKLILDGPGGLPVGKQCALAEVTGGSPAGPSIGLPMVDSVGNIWFIAAAELFKGTGSDFDSVLVRAVYDPDTFSYQLEKVFELGSKFLGRNSDREYMITFCGIADSNSFSSGTAFSGNMMQCGWGGRTTVENLDTVNPQTLGGMVFNAEIAYDVDQDGDFNVNDPADPTSKDEEYNCLMYLGWPGNKVGVGDTPNARDTGNTADPAVPPTGSGKASNHG